MKHSKKNFCVKKEEDNTPSQETSETFETIKKEEYLMTKQEELFAKKEENLKSEYSLKEEETLAIFMRRSLECHTFVHTYDFSSSSEGLGLGKDKTKRVTKKRVKGATSAKNIIKNYGRALQNFAVSNMCLPYIRPILEREKVTLVGFRKYLSPKKKEARSIAGLRSLLLIAENDDNETATYKRVFQELSVIFIKYFSVNWIFSGKLLNKIAHLKCRFKILRRVKDPQNFTYLKGFCELSSYFACKSCYRLAN